MIEKLPTEENPWTTLKSELVYENPWIKLEHQDVLTPAGTPGIYGRVHFKHWAVGVIPIDSELNTYLIGQYRYPLQKYSWEIPEGGGKRDESPLMAAQRELQEETGFIARHYTELQRMDLSNSVTDEQAFLFLAEGLEAGNAHPEETEKLRMIKLPFMEAFERMRAGEITDSLSVAAIWNVHYMVTQGWRPRA
jgi:ADP-ribose pyrophosphatase